MGKKIFLKDIKDKEIQISLMVVKKLYKDGNKTVYVLSDRSGYINAKINSRFKIDIGSIINVEGLKEGANLDVNHFEIVKDFDIYDYLVQCQRPIEDIMDDIEIITNECITSIEGRKLNDYFFKDEDFLEKFKRGIGGVSMHHNYIGGLAEHTLGVMNLTKILCDIYGCRRREIAVLGAKLHDIGKIYELDSSGIFKYTLEGELQGHIVIGVQMLDRAFRDMNCAFSDDFVNRIKGCIVQHHGKLEYGSPRISNMEESIILNYADTIDAHMNKIDQIKENTKENTWSNYDRRIDSKLYL